jgi:hypothetical protein
MRSKKQIVILIMSAIVLTTGLLFIDNVLSKDEDPESSKVVFYVS